MRDCMPQHRLVAPRLQPQNLGIWDKNLCATSVLPPLGIWDKKPLCDLCALCVSAVKKPVLFKATPLWSALHPGQTIGSACACCAGSCGQSGSSASGSPDAEKALALDPPQENLYSQ